MWADCDDEGNLCFPCAFQSYFIYLEGLMLLG